ncbi:MAG: 50S ribosomal protein L30 [Proteobacteria bacterium]|nr:50S ribosomal protein L30 [Pseudomonadota bacterium]
MKVIVKQTRSQIGRNQIVRDTLKALGLGRIGKEAQHELSPAVSGMIDRVKQVVRVRKA